MFLLIFQSAIVVFTHDLTTTKLRGHVTSQTSDYNQNY